MSEHPATEMMWECLLAGIALALAEDQSRSDEDRAASLLKYNEHRSNAIGWASR